MSSSLPPEFHRLAWSNLAAQSAEQIGLTAAPMVAVLVLGAGVGQTGLLAAAQSLPFLLLSFPAGIIADRMSRRGLMAIAEAVRTFALLALPALMGLGLLSLPLLAAIGFVTTTGTVAFSVAAPALVPSLVPRGALAAANGRLELARSLAFAAGPALAGALVGWAGTAPAFILAAVLSGSAVVLLIGLAEQPRPKLPPRHIFGDLREGAGFAWAHPLLRPVLLTAVVWNCSWFVLQAAFVPYAVQVLGLSASGIGAALASCGIGMVLGALVTARIVRCLSFGTAVVLGPLVSLVAALMMAATILLPNGFLAGASFFLFGAGPIVYVISQVTLRQTVTPAPLLGRVSALFMTANTGARPIGAALGGAIGAASGPSACIIVAAAGFAVQALIILCSPVPQLERLPEAVA
ncbi:MAG: transporter [Rhodospirillales bacterium]|nr:transporter [Rhodospirillales bacterium]